MRRLIKDIALRFGYQIRRVHKVDYQLSRLIRHKPGMKFVQVGANDGIRFDELYFFVTRNDCPGVVIEPLPDVFERLRHNYLSYPDIVPVNVALHPSAREATMYRVRPDRFAEVPEWAQGCASFFRGHLEKLRIPDELIEAQTVPCAPLMEVLEAYAALDADYLQIDTEGFDDQVIAMIDFARFKPSLVKFECMHLGPEQRARVEAIFTAAGYALMQDGFENMLALRTR